MVRLSFTIIDYNSCWVGILSFRLCLLCDIYTTKQFIIIIIYYIYYSAFPELKALYKYKLHTYHTCNGHALWTIPTDAAAFKLVHTVGVVCYNLGEKVDFSMLIFLIRCLMCFYYFSLCENPFSKCVLMHRGFCEC